MNFFRSKNPLLARTICLASLVALSSWIAPLAKAGGPMGVDWGVAVSGSILMPKIMGHLGDVYNMSVSFWMPLACFALIALYGFYWSKLSQTEGVLGLKGAGGHG